MHRTIQYHPDKLRNPTAEELAKADAYFVYLKSARDTLVNDARRFAYERFGPDMLQWKGCVTKLDYVTSGVFSTLPYYILSAGGLLAMRFLCISPMINNWKGNQVSLV